MKRKIFPRILKNPKLKELTKEDYESIATLRRHAKDIGLLG